MKKLAFASCLLIFFIKVHSQQVAINTDGTPSTDPKAMLEIKKNLYSKLKVRSTNYLDTSVLELSNRDLFGFGTDFRVTARMEQGLFFTSHSDLTANTNDSLLTVLINGNVGIGTKNPAYSLQVHSGTANGLMNITNSSTGMTGADGLFIGMQAANGIIGNLENGNLRLGTNNLTRVMIDPSGNVGINTLTPLYKLDVNGDLNLTNLLRLNGSTGTAGQVLASNGSSDPTWKNTALSNNTRFAFDVSLTSPATSLSSTGGFLNFSATKYNLDPSSISVSGNTLTISKSGLYHFELFYNVQFYYASSSTSVSPIHGSYISIDYPGGFNHLMAYQQDIRRQGTSNSWFYNSKASLEVYISAPRTILIHSFFSSLAGPTNLVIQDGEFYGHLISD